MSLEARNLAVRIFGVVCAGLFLAALFTNSQVIDLLAFIAVVVLSIGALLTGALRRAPAVRRRLLERGLGVQLPDDEEDQGRPGGAGA
jgi:hypothetical protein